MKNPFLLICVIILGFTPFKVVLADDLKEEQHKLILELKSENVFQRINGMEKIIKGLRETKLVLGDELKKTCNDLIMEVLEKRVRINTKADDEGIYYSSIYDLAELINDRKFLPYLAETADHINAIMQHGDAGIDALIEAANRAQNESEKKSEFAGAFAAVITLHNQGTPLSEKSRKKIKEQAVTLLNETKYFTPNDPEKPTVIEQQRLNRQARIKSAALKICAGLGDKDLIPLVKKIAQEDSYKKQVFEDTLPRLKMTDEERKANPDRRSFETVKAQTPKNRNKVDYYLVRDEAEKTLKILEKN